MTATQKACEALSSLLPNRVAFPNSTAYKTAEDTYYSAQENELSPSCVVFPNCTEDVVKIIKTLVDHDTKFAVRGGGHTSNTGAANIDGGVTINMRHMSKVTVNKDKQTVSVGGGAKWRNVYPVLDALNISTSGGRVADVGVGGLTTGGGISYFSGRKGLVCDNVQNFELVTSKGEIINANKAENDDLFRALRGGSDSNFGIVTQFYIRTFEQGKFLGGVTVTPISTIDTQLSNYDNLLHNYDPNAAIIMSISWNQVRNGYSIFSNLEYTQPVENPPDLEPFLKTEPKMLNTMRISNLSDFTEEAGKFSPNGGR